MHSLWFRNYGKIPAKRKYVTSILFVDTAVVLVSGALLMFGSRSEAVSHVHYASAIIFTVLAVVHVVRRWSLFRDLMKRH